MRISAESRRAALAAAACALFAVSCATTGQAGAPEGAEDTPRPAQADGHGETRPSAQDDPSGAERQAGGGELALLEKGEPAPPEKKTALDEYMERTGGLALSVASSPKETTKGKAFAAPFSVLVADADGAPVPGAEISVVYPAEKADGNVVFKEMSAVSGADGTVSFTADVPAFACDSSVTFYPKGDMGDEEVSRAAAERAISVPYRVRTNFRSSGGIIAVIDYNQGGTPILGNTLFSSNLLTSLMRRGFTGIGNSNSTINGAVVRGDRDGVYRETRNLVGSRSAFVIYGTVKYSDGADALVGEATALSLSDGSVLCRASMTAPIKGGDAAAARRAIADHFASVFDYGM